MKVINIGKNNWITPSRMYSGQIGIIRKWNVEGYVGMIVQQYGGRLVRLGSPSNPCLDHSGYSTHPDCLVEILPPGTTLEI